MNEYMTPTNSIEQNFNQHVLWLPSLTSGMAVAPKENLIYVDAGLSCDTCNIIHVTSGSSLETKELEEALQHYQQKNFAFCLWISQEHLTERVSGMLYALGLTQAGDEAGMVLDLNSYTVLDVRNQENIKTVSLSQEILDAADILSCNWTPPDKQLVQYYRLVSDNLLSSQHNSRWMNYYLNGQPVATVELFLSDNGIAGIYNLSTLAEYRGKGIGTALMKAALNLAKELGCQTAVLQASDDGVGIYKRLGFREVTRYYEFIRSNK